MDSVRNSKICIINIFIMVAQKSNKCQIKDDNMTPIYPLVLYQTAAMTFMNILLTLTLPNS